MSSSKTFLLLLCGVMVCVGAKSVFAQENKNALYVPSIGITSVPDPLTLPIGGGKITYYYAVKNFLAEAPVSNVVVMDNVCSPVTFANGDDNHDGLLQSSETWRYTCTKNITTSTRSHATVTGSVQNVAALRSTDAQVMVDAGPAPLMSINNTTRIPLPLPARGGAVTFIFRVNNTGVVPLQNVIVTADNCPNMSSKLGDTNGNNLLDVGEVWIYSCTATIMQTTTNTATVKAVGGGMSITSSDAILVMVASSTPSSQNLFDVGLNLNASQSSSPVPAWIFMAGILVALGSYFAATRITLNLGKKHNSLRAKKKSR